MRADAFLAAAEALPVRAFEDLVPAGGIVVVAPHPDDESLGCGGLIAEACARGIPVRLVVVSDGTGSHPNSKTHPPERLRLLRESETLAAVAHWAFPRPRRLPAPARPVRAVHRPRGRGGRPGDRRFGPGLRRGRPVRDLGARPALRPRGERRARPPRRDLLGRDILGRDILGRDILGNVRLYAYPVWGWTLPPESEVGAAPRGARLDIARHLPTKAAAIAAHRSQTTDLIADDPAGFRLEPAMLARFARDHEIVLEVAP